MMCRKTPKATFTESDVRAVLEIRALPWLSLPSGICWQSNWSKKGSRCPWEGLPSLRYAVFVPALKITSNKKAEDQAVVAAELLAAVAVAGHQNRAVNRAAEDLALVKTNPACNTVLDVLLPEAAINLVRAAAMRQEDNALRR
jgi:hypothetical protein